MPHTLLLADDSVTIQRVIELTFADEDVQVVAVSDGDLAIAAIEQRPPDIVLADVGMPGRDGYEVAQHIKKTPRLAHIPVLLLTGAFEPIDQVRASAIGCDGVLAKPFEPQLVIGRVKELLTRTSPADAAPAVFERRVAEPKDSVELPKQPHRMVDDQYFEELDQAFATLSAAPQSARIDRTTELPSEDGIGWFSQTAPVEPPPVASPIAATEPPPAPAATAPAVAAPAAPPVAFPPLADAFAALLAAEQTAPSPAAAPLWPAAPAPPTGDVVNEVTRRVLDQMTDRTVRETVSEIVSRVAERLVREEIERIKKSIV